MTKPLTIPEGYTDDITSYLYDLRDSGETNMMFAPRYLQEEFGLDRNTARDYVGYWMDVCTQWHARNARKEK